MRPIVCDKCDSYIDGEDNVFYAGVSNMILKDEVRVEKPATKTLELCPKCGTKVIEFLKGM